MRTPTKKIADYLQRGRDIAVFAELLGVRLNAGQVRWLRYAAETKDGWEWVWKQTIHVAANQIGKAQRIDEPVLTPDGWRPIGSLLVGDEVIAGDGTVTRVTGVFPQGVKPIYELTFDDGATTRTCNEHLWRVKDPESRFRKNSSRYGTWDVLSLGELRERYGDNPEPERRWAIPVAVVQFAERPVPVDPYALGLLIGDGSLKKGSIGFSSADTQLVEALRNTLPGMDVKWSGDYDYGVTAKYNWLIPALRNLGLWGKGSHEKFVPESYLRNSVDVRLAILQGLMDTDGTVGKSGSADFCSTSHRLALDVQELVRSLGGKAKMFERQTYYTHRGERRAGLPSYIVRATLPGMPLFRLERKQSRIPMNPVRRAERVIRSIKQVEDAPAVCISVEHPERTYITRDYIVTHNTLCVAILILWACMYKIGVPTSDMGAWFTRPYLWFHLAPTQQQAYHALNDCRQLIKGSHPAQGDRCMLVLVTNDLVKEAKVATYYDGLEFWNGAICQFRTTDDKASALQGYRASGISVDEAAFEDHLKIVVMETLMMRLISTGGPLHMVSTPNGMNDYFDFVEEVKKYNESPEDKVWVDREGMSVVCWSVITDNVGFGITQSQVDHMEANLDPATKEQQLRGAFLEPAEAFFVPGDRILASFRRGMADEEPPRAGRRYAIFWDVSVASDPTVAIVIDITESVWRGVYFRHYPRPMGITQLLNEMTMLHVHYNSAEDHRRLLPRSRAVTGYDATSMGGVMFKQMLRSITPSRPVNFGGPAEKLRMLTAARAVLTKGDLVLPDTWTRLRQEILSYRLKDDKLRQDCVMALTGVVNVANSGMAIGASRPMNVSARITPTRR